MDWVEEQIDLVSECPDVQTRSLLLFFCSGILKIRDWSEIDDVKVFMFGTSEIKISLNLADLAQVWSRDQKILTLTSSFQEVDDEEENTDSQMEIYHI